MKNVYLELKMGAAGDMLCAALIELLTEEQKNIFFKIINNLGLENVHVSTVVENKNGVSGTRFAVDINGVEEKQDDNYTKDSTLCGISDLISELNVSKFVRENACEIYIKIAVAESKVHGEPVDLVHFHEVGAIDAVVDIVGFCVLIELLGVEKIVCSPINVGGGFVRCAHGLLPVPAPATAELLRDMPSYSSGIDGELCTPTGAALVGHFATEYSKLLNGSFSKIGYGMGKKNFAVVNCVRAFLYDIEKDEKTEIIELRCNIDDMTSESIAFLSEQIMDNGARDVYVQSVTMKKGRTGFVVVCLCEKKDEIKFTRLIFKFSTTIGIRVFECHRHVLTREFKEIETKHGSVKIKHVTGYGVERQKPEYEDIAKIARDKNISLEEVKTELGL